MTRVTGGQDRFNQWGWLWRRTHRLAMLLLEPNILAGALDLVQGLDRWCDSTGTDQARVGVGEAKFIRGLTYIELPLVIE